MGKLRNVFEVENRIYDDHTNPEISDYDVALPVTSLNAVKDPNTGKTATEVTNELKALAQSAVTKANTAQATADSKLSQTTADGRYLGKSDRATDSAKFGGNLPSVFALDSSLTTHKNDTTAHLDSAEHSKLEGIAVGANNYVHPSTHPASMIVEDSTHRFVTDGEKTAWNNSGGVIVQATAPTGNASKLWIDTSVGGVAKYWNGTVWVGIAATWAEG